MTQDDSRMTQDESGWLQDDYSGDIFSYQSPVSRALLFCINLMI